MKYILLALLFTFNLSAGHIYIDEADLEIREDTFYIHMGGNMWNETDTIYTDDYGLYYVETKTSKAMVRKWKCPYCHMMWPEGQRCQNAKCPSKYNVK